MAEMYEMTQAQAVAQRAAMTRVFGWMTAALAITAVMAMMTVVVAPLRNMVYGTRFVFFGLLIAEVLLVWGVSASINRISAATATGLFVLYSALNGLTMSFVFLAYTATSVYSTFFVTAATFGAMCVYGIVTRRDLTSLGSLCFMLLIGLILASIVNIFWASSTLYWIVTYAGVLIFVGLTAYDAQKIKAMVLAADTPELAQKVAIMGALNLYLDFINLFLYLLRLMGRRN